MHRNPEGPGFQFFNKNDDVIFNFGSFSLTPTVIKLKPGERAIGLKAQI
jgi:hypothetical protein